MRYTLEYYVKLFSKLRTDRARWKGIEITQEQAPHKPLLLLSIIEQFKQATINVNLIELNPDLSESFGLYWFRIMPPDSNGNIVMPFFHLKSDGFWKLKPQGGRHEILASKRAVRSTTEMNELAVGAELDTLLCLWQPMIMD
jgi:putative restriction endonuclease